MLNFFEITVIGASVLLLIRSTVKKERAEFFLLCLSSAAVLCGELVNSFWSKSTEYNPSFMIWIYRTGIPVFIVCGGAVVSYFLFKAAALASRRNGARSKAKGIAVFLVVSLVFPMIEVAGIELGLWRWLKPSALSFDWLFGVWQFYFIFVGAPALLAFYYKTFRRG